MHVTSLNPVFLGSMLVGIKSFLLSLQKVFTLKARRTLHDQMFFFFLSPAFPAAIWLARVIDRLAMPSHTTRATTKKFPEFWKMIWTSQTAPDCIRSSGRDMLTFSRYASKDVLFLLQS